MKARILLVDDKASNLSLLKEILGEDYLNYSADSGEAALQLLSQQSIDVVLSDVRMPTMDGFELLKTIKRTYPQTQVVLMTAYGSIEKAVEAMQQGAFNYLTKPLDPDKVLEVIETALAHKYALAPQSTPAPSHAAGFAGMVGSSAPMQRLYGLLRRAAKSDATVLLLGESGTGKDLTAEAIHRESRRSQGPFVAINCGALPAELIESELFGFEKGAFTGADRNKLGLFREAEGGTLFLDEVGELPLPMQVKLNRALQARAIRPIGTAQEQSINVRVVAATNRNLIAEIEKGTFREDLYYRLNVFSLELPPLRKRADDISLLASTFIERHRDSLQTEQQPNLGEEALKLLQNYPWPGNIRELENAIQRALALCDGQEIGVPDLPEQLSQNPAKLAMGAMAYKDAMDLARAEASRNYLVELMRSFQGNVTQAAIQAGVERESLHRLLKKNGVSPQAFRPNEN